MRDVPIYEPDQARPDNLIPVKRGDATVLYVSPTPGKIGDGFGMDFLPMMEAVARHLGIEPALVKMKENWSPVDLANLAGHFWIEVP